MPVLTYHRIADPEQGVEPTLTVSAEDFHEQLNWIKHHGYTSITASHLSEALAGRATMPPRPVLLTFDDGYRDLCDFAFPALAASGLSATVFVVTGELGQFSSWDKAFGWNPLPLMSSEQIRQWSGRGIDFGAHSRTHRDLTRIPPEDLVSELEGSALDLSQILDKKVSSFAYPHGRQNAIVRSLAERYFSLAFSCEEGLNTTGIDQMRIRRTMVRPRDSMHAFSHRITKGVSPVYDLRNWRAKARIRSRFRDILSWLRFA
jgi:peptidoglycan/xylan/chitin deacetylase (PgdA/CDA1 family)